jgi:hypothetical protein
MTEHELVKLTEEVGYRIGKAMPKGWGFALFIFPFGPNGTMHYVSNANRDDIVTTLMEFIARSQEKGFYGQHVDRNN